MSEAYIYDAVRTPRGKGKKNGSLHEITALSLATQSLQAIRDRNELDTRDVDDVVLGCVSPVGEQGADIARIEEAIQFNQARVKQLELDLQAVEREGWHTADYVAARVVDPGQQHRLENGTKKRDDQDYADGSNK